MIRHYFILLSTILLLCFIQISSAEIKVCAYEGVTDVTYCIRAESNGDIKCVWVVDSVDCANKITSREVDVAGFTAEQALLVANKIDSYVEVLAEVRHVDHQNENYAYQSVVIVKDYNQNGDWKQNIRRKKFCHPGYKYENLWTNRVINEFEHEVVTKLCNNISQSADEDLVASADNFFGDSCRPGPWTADPKRDLELKKKYPKLCKICADQCNYRSKFSNSHLAALDCLTEGRGEITYVSLRHAKDHFETISDKSSYKYLCREGNTEDISPYPCTWINQPWPVVFVRKDKNIIDELKTKIADNFKQELVYILTRRDGEFLYKENKSPTEYMEERLKVIKSDVPYCKNDITWCTISGEEQEKCDWLKQAITYGGIVPNLKCEKGSDLFDCFKKIEDNNMDLISVDSNYGYLTRKHYHLAPVFYHTTMNEKSFVIAVIKEESKNNINKFADLKNKQVCFPEYGGIAWISFVMAARNNKVLPKKGCDYKKQVCNFVGNTCAPGARDPGHYIVGHSEEHEEKLCSLCPLEESGVPNCDASTNNVYFGNSGAMLCLNNGTGDVAIVEKFNLTDLNFNEKDYRVLCKNNSLALKTGFDVDENCALSVTVDSEILTRKTNSNEPHFEVFLLQLEKWFGLDSNKQQTTMHMFKPYNNVKNLLFKENVIGFDDTNNPDNKYTTNYHELFKSVDACSLGTISNMISINALIFSLYTAIKYIF